MLCPACNALEPLVARCLRCGAAASDEGRLVDWFGPYSPYSLDDGQRLDAIAAGVAAENACVHAVSCPECESLFPVPVNLFPL